MTPQSHQRYPHHLITQRDARYLKKYSRPTNYLQASLLPYGANCWKRIDAAADEFERYWKQYIYQISTGKEKCFSIQRDSQKGDTVLIEEKNTPRLKCPTGTIVEIFTDKDSLICWVIVQSHKKHGRTRTLQLKDEAIHDMVLMKAVTAKDNPGPEDTSLINTPKEAKALSSHISTDERELFWEYRY